MPELRDGELMQDKESSAEVDALDGGVDGSWQRQQNHDELTVVTTRNNSRSCWAGIEAGKRKVPDDKTISQRARRLQLFDWQKPR